MAWSVARPSRRKNEPGILPAAYIRSSMSTVRGKKSTPSRTLREAVAVQSTMVLPSWARTAPSASCASLPAWKDMVLSVPLIGDETETGSVMCVLLFPRVSRVWFGAPASSQLSATRATVSARGAGDWQLTRSPLLVMASKMTRAAPTMEGRSRCASYRRRPSRAMRAR